jgi:hypothetical protein
VKVDPFLKWIFYLSFSLLYISGAADFAFQWINGSPSPAQSFVLRVHGIVGLWFLYLFGHFFKAHIWPSLRQLRHRRSGLTLWFSLIVLSLSVPALYYVGNDQWRAAIVGLHTYLGLFVLLPLLAHIALAIYRRGSK